MQNPKQIWLSPRCPKPTEAECGHPEEIFADVGGRMWCQDDVWGPCPECGAKSPRYILAEE